VGGKETVTLYIQPGSGEVTVAATRATSAGDERAFRLSDKEASELLLIDTL